MKEYNPLLDSFVQRSRDILGDNLLGIYLHGSAAMGCFHYKISDIDLLIVIKKDISDGIKRQYMDMVIELNKQAPAKGIELSMVRECVCNPFVYPTPFELHFSIAHINWYQTSPEVYIKEMKGTDKDLAAHFTIIYHRGKTLYGKGIKEVFSEVRVADYFDSIWNDIKGAKEEIANNPTYMILNLCRVLAYKKDHLILSKLEGGGWGLANIPKAYTNLISDAWKAYQAGEAIQVDKLQAQEYAAYMLRQIRE